MSIALIIEQLRIELDDTTDALDAATARVAQLQNERDRLAAALNALSPTVVVVDEHGQGWIIDPTEPRRATNDEFALVDGPPTETMEYQHTIKVRTKSPAVNPPAQRATKKPAKKKPADVRKPDADQHTCPTCGDTLPTARGLAIHTSLKHKPEPRTADELPAPNGASNVQRTGADFRPDELHLECDDCDAAFATHEGAKLLTHTLGIHGRRPRPDEKTPRKASR